LRQVPNWTPGHIAGIFRQESSKEVDVNYEILFARACNQLRMAKITRNCGIPGVDRLIFTTKLADFMLNILLPHWEANTFVLTLTSLF